MKFPKFIALVFISAASAFAAQAEFACTFTPPSDADSSFIYSIEAKRSDGTWSEVASGPQNAINYFDNAPFGIYTVRVRVKSPAVSPYSDEASTNLAPGKPTNVKIISSRSSASIEVTPSKAARIASK